MSKHTPGPWTVDAPADRRAPLRVVAVKSPYEHATMPFEVCKIAGRSNVYTRPNAHLIAAAPELLAALLAWSIHFGPLEDNSMLHEDCRKLFALARAAMAKAEGRS